MKNKKDKLEYQYARSKTKYINLPNDIKEDQNSITLINNGNNSNMKKKSPESEVSNKDDAINNNLRSAIEECDRYNEFISTVTEKKNAQKHTNDTKSLINNGNMALNRSLVRNDEKNPKISFQQFIDADEKYFKNQRQRCNGPKIILTDSDDQSLDTLLSLLEYYKSCICDKQYCKNLNDYLMLEIFIALSQIGFRLYSLDDKKDKEEIKHIRGYLNSLCSDIKFDLSKNPNKTLQCINQKMINIVPPKNEDFIIQKKHKTTTAPLRYLKNISPKDNKSPEPSQRLNSFKSLKNINKKEDKHQSINPMNKEMREKIKFLEYPDYFKNRDNIDLETYTKKIRKSILEKNNSSKSIKNNIDSGSSSDDDNEDSFSNKESDIYSSFSSYSSSQSSSNTSDEKERNEDLKIYEINEINDSNKHKLKFEEDKKRLNSSITNSNLCVTIENNNNIEILKDDNFIMEHAFLNENKRKLIESIIEIIKKDCKEIPLTNDSSNTNEFWSSSIHKHHQSDNSNNINVKK